jgi:CPA1 family monovalent cation:H+ antiporter
MQTFEWILILLVSAGFAYRDLILLVAFCVVVGTLVLQGLTLRPLIVALKLHDDHPVEREVSLAAERVIRAGLTVLEHNPTVEAKTIRRELESQLSERTEGGSADRRESYGALRRRIVASQREALLRMRASGEIGDTAFHQIEAQLDVAELNAAGGLNG